jgi:hypothetical protein
LARPRDVVCATGSLTTVAAAREALGLATSAVPPPPRPAAPPSPAPDG